MPGSEVVYGFSLDFDGCFAPDSDNDILIQHKIILDKIKALKGDAKAKLFIGTNRQSIVLDDEKTKDGSGSCFPRYLQIADYLGIELDKMLLADLYHKEKNEGTNFNLAINLLGQGINYQPRPKANDWFFDDSKLSLLYCQIHKLAIEHPKAKIKFYFYDDRDDILSPLHDYFAKNLKRLPKNVTLHLEPYPLSTKTYPSLQGTGKTDKNYRKTLFKMAEHVFNNTDIRDKFGKRVTTLKEAEDAQWQLSDTNFIKAYNLNEEPVAEATSSQPPSPASPSPLTALSFTQTWNRGIKPPIADTIASSSAPSSSSDTPNAKL